MASCHTTIWIGHQHFTNDLRRSRQCFVYHIWGNAMEKVPKKNHQTLLQRFVQFLVNHQACLPYIYFSIIQDLLEFIYIWEKFKAYMNHYMIYKCVYRAVQVKFMLNWDSTRPLQVGENGTYHRLIKSGLIGWKSGAKFVKIK